MSRPIVKKYTELDRDCNLVSLFYFEFISYNKIKPTEQQITSFVKKFQESEIKEAEELRRVIKKAMMRDAS